jgi:hypothetical protein
LYWLAGNYFKTKEEVEKLSEDDKKVLHERFDEVLSKYKLSKYE